MAATYLDGRKNKATVKKKQPEVGQAFRMAQELLKLSTI
jgi:hypothetical protein